MQVQKFLDLDLNGVNSSSNFFDATALGICAKFTV